MVKTIIPRTLGFCIVAHEDNDHDPSPHSSIFIDANMNHQSPVRF